MRCFLVVVLAVGALTLTGCGSTPSVQFETQDGRVLAKAAAASSEAYQAIISGELSVLEGGCAGLSNGGTGYVAVFPAGTTLLDEGVAIPGIGEFAFGDDIRGQGGVVPHDSFVGPDAEWVDSLPEGCPAEQIYVFTP